MSRIEVQEMSYIVDNSTSDLCYVGISLIGNTTKVSEPVWKIMKIVTTSNIDYISWAEGNRDYNKIWNNRTLYEYK